MRSWMIATTLAIASVGLWPELPDPTTITAVLASAILAGVIAGFWQRKLLIILPIALGVAWSYAHGFQLLSSLIPTELEGKDLLVRGEIVSLPKIKQGKASFVLKISSSSDPRLTQKQVRLSWYKPLDVKGGDRYQLLIRLKRPRSFQNPGGFDYESWLLRKGIVATGYVRESKSNISLGNPTTGFIHYRQELLERLNTNIKDLGNKRFIPALGFGFSAGISNNDWQVLQQTGTIHLLVISGLHVGLAAFWGYLSCSFLSRVLYGSLRILPSQKWGLIGGLLVGFFYAALSGFSLPTQRAVIMLAMAFGCRFFSSRMSVKDIILISLFVVTALDPLCVYDRGFWLSFGAVIILVLGLSNKLTNPFNVFSKISMWARAQLVIFVGLLPILFYFLNSFSLVSPIANLVAVSVVSFLVIPIILLSILLIICHIPPMELLIFVDYVLGMLWNFLDLFSELNSLLTENIGFRKLDWQGFMTLSLLAIIMISPRFIPYNRTLCILLIPALLFGTEKRFAAGEAKVYVLDVGQGLSVYVETQNHNLLFDTGRKFSPNFSAASSAVIPFLQNRARKSLDMLIISHHDNDHIGGTGDILTKVTTKTLISSSTPSDYTPLPWETCRAGQKWRWDQVDFEFLYPEDKLSKKSNNQSCVLKVSTNAGSLLITGDIEKSAELKLVSRQREKLNSDFLVAPHHGSKTSSSLPLIRATSPKWVLFSTGYRNPFNHPHPSIINRYKNRQINTVNTSDSGLISFKLDSRSSPERYRSQKMGYWW